jgi:adenosylcobinamide-GDP ribazoletransferase
LQRLESPTPAAEAFRGALAFLTCVPVGRRPPAAADVVRGAALFPLVGAGVGAAAAGTGVLLDRPFPALLAAALAVAAEAVLTGALHVDGLADTADALGARSRERALEIMRDPRIGTFGTCAVVLDLLLRTAAFTALLGRGGTVALVAVAGALSRAAILPLAAALPYARPGGGLSDGIGWLAAAAGVGLAAVLALGIAGWTGAAMLGAAALATALLWAGYRRRFAGVTGDTLGAAVEVAAIASLLVAAGLR